MTSKIETTELGYRVDDSPVLADVSVAIEDGETVAIVGPSGVGKSTFLRLLVRLDEPTEGTVYYEGRDYRSVDSLRSLGWVWIPGLMAGIIMSGENPIYAAEYQFVVMAMIFAAAGLSSLVCSLLVEQYAFTDAQQLKRFDGDAT